MNTQEVTKLYEKYLLSNYKRLPLCLVKGKGSRVWDLDGKEYLDFFPGWAVSGLGHCHPKVVSAIKEQSKKILHVSNNYMNPKQALLAKEIVEASFPSRLFFCNSGAEAVEGAIKFARKWGNPKGRYEIITMNNSFHGRTLAAMTATGQPKYQKGFEPLPEGFKYAEFNNLESVKSLLTNKTVAVMCEPVQGEGGIHVASQDFLKGLRRLTEEKGMLLILDEVQTGMARTGKMFAYQHYGITPDLMILAKSLGGGVPIGALVVHEKLGQDILTPGTHASTYGGNPLVTAAALAVFKVIREEKLIERVNELAPYLEERLEGFKKKYSFIQEIRQLGFMCGIQLKMPGLEIVTKCIERGLLINCTQDTVLRLVPAINIPKKLLDKGLYILDKVLGEVKL
jgi:acetylornithine/N-succinyldiaminopimelate aminotransferase